MRIYRLNASLCSVAGSAPEGERPSIAAPALQSHVSDRPQTQTPRHPACSQTRGSNSSVSVNSLRLQRCIDLQIRSLI